LGYDLGWPRFFFAFKIIAVITANNSSVSRIKGFNRDTGTISDSAKSRNQYKLSFASFCATPYLWMKSARVSPDWASSIFAPMDVADLKYCFPRIQHVPSLLSCNAW